MDISMVIMGWGIRGLNDNEKYNKNTLKLT